VTLSLFSQRPSVTKEFQKLISLLLLNNPKTNLTFLTEHRLCCRDDLQFMVSSSSFHLPVPREYILLGHIAGQVLSILNLVFQTSWVQCQLLPVIIIIITIT